MYSKIQHDINLGPTASKMVTALNCVNRGFFGLYYAQNGVFHTFSDFSIDIQQIPFGNLQVCLVKSQWFTSNHFTYHVLYLSYNQNYSSHIEMDCYKWYSTTFEFYSENFSFILNLSWVDGNGMDFKYHWLYKASTLYPWR